MTVVIDSGVWISAFQFGGTPLAALERAFLSDTIAYCDQILAEIQIVLTRKFAWDSIDIRALLADFLIQGTEIEVLHTLHGISRDPKDDMVFECAVIAKANRIVSGDRDLLVVGRYQGIHILTPREYLASWD